MVVSFLRAELKYYNYFFLKITGMDLVNSIVNHCEFRPILTVKPCIRFYFQEYFLICFYITVCKQLYFLTSYYYNNIM